MAGSLSFLEDIAAHMLDLFPMLAHVRVLRQWAGVCDMTPDYSPVMGFTPVKGFLVDVGWGTYGFKASPIAGKTMAELIATQRTPDLIAPFRLSRFMENDLVGEKGAASVGH
jgi:sarcosine oxidase subunit beta